MRVVLQRAREASVSVGGEVVAGFERPCLVALVGVTHDDTPAEAAKLAGRVLDLRILPDERSAGEAGWPVLAVSQFTLYADSRKGRRPSWHHAAPGPVAEPLFDAFVAALRERGAEVGTGVFGADMAVALVNDGPVTLILDATAG